MIREYNFSHWPTLPKVSCQCITYGRPAMINEAVNSFLLQDYPGEKELIILNDQNNLKYFSDIPEIKIYNLDNRISSIGEKRNVSVELSTGEIMFPWDDDDISLPHRISFSIENMSNLMYFKGDSFWFLNNGIIEQYPCKNVAHAMGAYSKNLHTSIGGYDHIHSGQDATFEDKASRTGYRHVTNLKKSDVYYIYRFANTGSYHLSTFGYGNGLSETDKYVSDRKIQGEYTISPIWENNYVAMIKELI